MTLVDTNLLVDATFADAPEHDRARAWLEERLAEPDGLGHSLLAGRLRARATDYESACIRSARAFGRSWLDGAVAYLEQPAARLVTAGTRHAAIAAELAATPGLRSEDVPDIELAALAIEHGLVLASHDHGFRRFAGLRVLDPLA